MIAYLNGTVFEREQGAVIVVCQGVGYRVAIPTRDEETCRAGQSAEFYIYHDTREGCDDLYGFLTKQDRSVFELLLRVSRIGPKSAMDLLSRATGDAILAAIHSGDPEKFRAVTNVGKKISQRIVAELASKVQTMNSSASGLASSVITALIGLGYRESEAHEAFAHVDSTETEEEQMKQALAYFGKRS